MLSSRFLLAIWWICSWIPHAMKRELIRENGKAFVAIIFGKSFQEWMEGKTLADFLAKHTQFWWRNKRKEKAVKSSETSKSRLLNSNFPFSNRKCWRSYSNGQCETETEANDVYFNVSSSCCPGNFNWFWLEEHKFRCFYLKLSSLYNLPVDPL